MTSKPSAARTGPLLAFALLSGIYILVLILVLLDAALFVPLIVALRSRVDYIVIQLSELVAAGSIPGLLVIYYGVFTLKRAPDDPTAVEVAPHEAPALWAAVYEAAAAVGTRPPTRLRMVASANAAVAEETRLLGFASGRRDLTIGLPLLLGVSADELRAVLAHEMGHYARGHTRSGARLYRGSVALRNTCQGLRAARENDSRRRSIRGLAKITSLYALLAYGILSAYSAFYDKVSFAARRRQEFQADAYAAGNHGSRVTANALRSAHALPVAWTRFRDGYLEPMRKAGYRSDDPFGAFEAMLADPDYRDVFAELWRNPPQGPVSRFDSHPTLAQRLAALESLDARGGAAPASASAGSAAGAASDLLTGGQRRDLSRALGHAMFPSETGPDLPWPAWVAVAATLSATAPARDLLRAAGRVAAGAPASLHTVLDVLEAGRGADLERGPGEDRVLSDRALLALIGQYLVTAGRAEWTVSWTGPGRLIAADSAADDLPDLVAAAIGRPAGGVARLRLHLAALGVDPAATAPAQALASLHTPGAQRPGADPARPPAAVGIAPTLDPLAAERRDRIRVLTAVVAMVACGVSLAGLHRLHTTPTPPTVTVAVPTGIPVYPPLSPLIGTGMGAGLGASAYPTSGYVPLPPIDLQRLLNSIESQTSVTVRPGDTLSLLACRYRTTVRMLQEINGLGDSDRIRTGQRVRVPATTGTSSACRSRS
jgi:Zn-dependent protease with chaperone function/nucleoid-associated protein YgaU